MAFLKKANILAFKKKVKNIGFFCTVLLTKLYYVFCFLNNKPIFRFIFWGKKNIGFFKSSIVFNIFLSNIPFTWHIFLRSPTTLSLTMKKVWSSPPPTEMTWLFNRVLRTQGLSFLFFSTTASSTMAIQPWWWKFNEESR